MNPTPDHDRRDAADRRRNPLPFWHPRRLRGRRGRDRRAERDGAPYFVERGSATMLAMAIMLLLMTIVDGVITVGLIERGCEEANPLMRVRLWNIARPRSSSPNTCSPPRSCPSLSSPTAIDCSALHSASVTFTTRFLSIFVCHSHRLSIYASGQRPRRTRGKPRSFVPLVFRVDSMMVPTVS